MGYPTVTIAGQSFLSKAEAFRFLRALLGRYADLERVTAEDDAFLRDLFAWHPDHAQKLRGCEISHFEKHPYVHGSRCFYLVRADGTHEHFSMEKCIHARFAAARSVKGDEGST